MPLLQNGVYIGNDEGPYEAESAYYLNFHILSALVSIEHLFCFEPSELWENKCQYYHYYTDHLLFCIGQIANRFVIGNSNGLRLDRKKKNRDNYRFTDERYPILSNKDARNAIEHIDERNQQIIAAKNGVGGFNLIDNDTAPNLEMILREKKDLHPYTLDLKKNEILIRSNNIDWIISITELKAELESLLHSVRDFRELITNSY